MPDERTETPATRPEEASTDHHAPPRLRAPETLVATLRRFGRLWGFLGFLVFVLVLFRAVILPFIFGSIIAYLLAPIIRRFEPRFGRAVGVLVVYLAIFSVLGVFFGVLLPAVFKDFDRLRQAMPGLVERFESDAIPRITSFVHDTFGETVAQPNPSAVSGRSDIVLVPQGDGTWAVDLQGVSLSIAPDANGGYVIGPVGGAEESLGDTIRRHVASKGTALTSALGGFIQEFVRATASFLTRLVLTFMIAAFMLIDLDRVAGFVRYFVPVEYQADFDEISAGLDRGLAGVIRGQLLICLVNGVLTFVGLLIFEIKYSFLLGLLAGTFSLVPIFGTILSSIPIVLVALVSSETGPDFGAATGILIWIAFIHLLEANVLNPKIIGDAAHMHPVIVVFSLLAGEHVYGLVGALLAVPVASMVQTFFMFARRRSVVHELRESR